MIPPPRLQYCPFSNTQQRQRSDGQSTASCEVVLRTPDLLQPILANLPARALLMCRCVCKHWRDVIADRHMLQLWKLPRNPTGVFIKRSKSEQVTQVTHIPLSWITEGSSRRGQRKTLSLNFIQYSYMEIIHSSNGLLVCQFEEFNCFCLYNPITKKHRQIPTPNHDVVISMTIALETTVSYKVVAICHSESDGPLQIEVLEANRPVLQWMNAGVEFPVFGDGNGVNMYYGACVDEVIYWPCYTSSGILSFNVRQGTLVWRPQVQQPDNNAHSTIAYFGECSGKLRMVKHSSILGAEFDMLELHSDHSAWFIKYHIDLTPRAARVNPLLPLPILILALLPGEEADGDIEGSSYVVVQMLGEVVSYNFKDQSIRKVCDLSFRPTEGRELRDQPWSYVLPYVETIVPLLE